MKAALINMAPLIAREIRFSNKVSNQVQSTESFEFREIVSNTIFYPVRVIHDMVDSIRETTLDELEKGN